VLDTAKRLFHSLEEEPQGHILTFQCYESMWIYARKLAKKEKCEAAESERSITLQHSPKHIIIFSSELHFFCLYLWNQELYCDMVWTGLLHRHVILCKVLILDSYGTVRWDRQKRIKKWMISSHHGRAIIKTWVDRMWKNWAFESTFIW
jgi:hypothetical protein